MVADLLEEMSMACKRHARTHMILVEMMVFSGKLKTSWNWEKGNSRVKVWYKA